MHINGIFVTVTICLLSILSWNTSHANIDIDVRSHFDFNGKLRMSHSKAVYHKIFHSRCHNSNECLENEICIRNRCENKCNNYKCATNARAVIVNHTCTCKCAIGYVGDPCNRGCIIPNLYPTCDINEDCPTYEACVNRKCDNTCQLSCGFKEVCKIRNHISRCECVPEYRWNSIISRCVRPNRRPACLDNSRCSNKQICVDGECINTCYMRYCGANAQCIAFNHTNTCECSPGYIRNSVNYKCVKQAHPYCNTNDDCPDYEMCHQKKCVSACDRNPPCGDNTNCFTSKHKRICECLPGLKGDPYNGGCKKINPDPYCNTDDDCHHYEMCHQKKCVSACDSDPLHNDNTNCYKAKHTCICEWALGLIGDIHNGGSKKLNPDPYCNTNDDCPDYEMCHQKKCVSACDCNPPCGDNTNCYTAKHKRICECLPGLKGDPYNGGCKKINPGLYCGNNTDCADDQICHGEKCVNVCGIKSLCGPNTTCIAKNHFSICACSPGFTGDPYGRGCTRLVHGCWNNPDCADNEVCSGGKCILGCDEQPSCGHGTSCSTIDHIRECVCLPGYEGDAYGKGCDECTAVTANSL